MFLYLGSTIYANNSNVFVTAIGRNYPSSDDPNNGPLQCVTDRIPCCSPIRFGEWFFPNGTQVLPWGVYDVPLFYRNRGSNGTVYLNRAVNATFPTGPFCCMVPDSMDTNQTLCAKIGRTFFHYHSCMTQFPNTVTVKVAHYGRNTAGERHIIRCYVPGVNNFIDFQWLDNHGTPVINNDSIIIRNRGRLSILRFFPLHQSHGGTYTCSATIDGSTESKLTHFNVNGIIMTCSV